MAASLFRCWDPVWLESLLVWCVLSQSLWFHLCIVLWGWKTLYLWSQPVPQALIIFLSFLSHSSHSLHTLCLAACLSLIPISCKEKLLWGGLRETLIYRYSNMSLGINLLPCSLSNLVNLGCDQFTSGIPQRVSCLFVCFFFLYRVN